VLDPRASFVTADSGNTRDQTSTVYESHIPRGFHINNGGYSGYGPGFWGAGHDPYTWQVSPHASACMSSMVRAVGFHGEDVTEPAEIIPALRRALDENARGRPAFLEFICSHHPVHGGWVRPA
jgi:thiamine pyrophosphate-dependent acetolactate synthase large subunit-like protein